MKVAQILYSGLGGHGSVVFSLIGGDRERRWTNVLGFLGVEPLLPEYRARCEAASIHHRYFQAIAGRPWARWFDVAHWLSTERPDAIVNHSGTALLPCLWHARRHGIPLIHVEHTPIQTKSRGEWLFSRLAMSVADHVVMLTTDYAEASQRYLSRHYRANKVAVIANGIDTSIFSPAQRPVSNGKIGMAARFSPAKRQDLLVTVIAELARLYGPERWHLSLAGDGSEHKRVAQVAAELAPGLVTFEGSLEETALADWLRTLDIYVHASDGETLSTALLQAMASGLPIVASDVAGIRNLIVPGTGVLVDNSDVAGWAAAIATLTSDREYACNLGMRAHETLVQNFGNVAMWRRYDALLAVLT